MKKRIITLLFIFLSLSLYAQKHNAELTYHETFISIKNGKMYKKLLYKIKICNRAGEKYTKVRVPYSGIQKVKKLEASITEVNGKIIKKIKKNDIIDKSAISHISLYEDDYVKEFTLKHNSYPYFLNYSYEEEIDEFLDIINWYPIIDTEIPTKSAKLIIEHPSKYEVTVKERKPDNYKHSVRSGLERHVWEASYKNLVESEVLSPYILDLLPNVKVLPKTYYFGTNGSLMSWKDFGNWQYRLNDGLSDLPAFEKNKILKLTEGISSDKEKIKILYHYLQDETRYINISIGTGGLKTYPADYVAQKKYWDCKALSNYFKAILEFVGIKSYYSKVFAGEKIRPIDTSFVSQQSNHIILFIPFPKDTLWLDCTSSNAFGYLGTFTQNRNALIVDKDNSHFVKTPPLSIRDVMESRMIKITPGENNIALAKFTTIYRGDKYEFFHEVYNNYNKAQKDRIVRKYLVDNGFELQEYEIKPEDRDSAKIEFNYSAKSDKIYMKYGNELVIRVIPLSLPKFEPVDERKFPVQIDYPIYKIDTIEFQLPIGYKSNLDLKSINLKSEFGHIKTEFKQTDTKVIFIRHFLLNSGFLTLEKYPEFYNFIKSVKGAENKNHFLISKDQ